MGAIGAVTDGRPFQPGPMPFTLLLDEALRQTRAHIRAIFPAVALPVAVLAGLAGVLQVLDLQKLLAVAGQTVLWSPQVLLTALALGFVSAVAFVAGQTAALDALAGRPVEMGRAWRFAVRPAVLATLLLTWLAVLASFVLCVLPVFVVGPLLVFAVPVMAEEGRMGTAALRRSADLALYNPSGNLWEHPVVKILLLMLVTSILGYMAGSAVALPFQIPMFVDIFRKAVAGEEDFQGAVARWIWLQIPAQFLSSLVRTAVYVYTAFGVALFYADQRARREGSDLRREIDALFPGPQTPQTLPPPVPGPPPLPGERR